MSDISLDWTQAEATFGQALKEMARLTELPLKKVVRAEAGSVLKACAGETAVAKTAQVPGRARSRLIRDLGLNSGDLVISPGSHNPSAAGRIVAISTGGHSHGKRRTAFLPGNPTGKAANVHWSNRDWAKIQTARTSYVGKVRQAVAAAVRAIGLSRQSWIQIADSLGIRLESVPGGKLSAAGIAKARKAIASDGKAHVNGHSREAESAESYFVDLVNGYPANQRLGMPAILLKAINGRRKHFERLLAKGVFDSMENVAKQFPGFYVNPGSK